MSLKYPFDPTEMMKMFDPQHTAKVFAPSQFLAAFAPLSAKGIEIQALMDANKNSFEAMVAANQAAGSAYREFYQQQVQIFELMTSAAQQHADLQSDTPVDMFVKKQSEIYQAAVEKAFVLMTGLAETMKKTNEQAFANMEEQIDTAINEIKKAS